MARNAYNGMPIWKYTIHGRYLMPFAAGQGRVFSVDNGKIIALDAKSGIVLKTYGSIGHSYGKGYFLVKNGSLIVVDNIKVRTFNINSGAELWSCALSPKSKALVNEDKVFIYGENECKCLELKSGKEIWKSDFSSWSTPKTNLFLAQRDLLIFDDAKERGKIVVHAVSSRNGRTLWTHDYTYEKSAGRWHVFYIKDTVWLQKSGIRKFEGLDPKTGNTKKIIPFPKAKVKLSGCHPMVATERYFLFSRPSDFLDLKTGKHFPFRLARCA